MERQAAESRTVHFMVPGPIGQATGGYHYDRRIVEGLRGRGWTVTVHELPGSYPRVDESAILAADIALSRIPDRAAVVVDGLATPGLAAAMALDGRRLGLVALVHHPLWLESGLAPDEAAALRHLEQGALASVKRIVVTSRATVADVVAMGLPADRIDVVVPGTDPAPPATGSADGVPTLLSVATLTPRKGHLPLLEALAAAADLPWRLVLAGSAARDPDHAAAVRRAIGERGLDGRVTVAGELDPAGLEAAWTGADLFVQASLYEGYGMALTEALARGLPVVATAVGAAPGVVAADGAGGAAGLLVPPGDAAALAAALRRVLADADLRGRLAAGARAAAGTLPRWDDSVDRFAEVLRRVVP